MPLEVVGLESSDPRWIVGAIENLQGKTYRIRSIGSAVSGTNGRPVTSSQTWM